MIPSEASSPASSSSSSPTSLPMQPIMDQTRQSYGETYNVHPAGVVDDYGSWDPSPRSSGGFYAPIHHGEVS